MPVPPGFWLHLPNLRAGDPPAQANWAELDRWAKELPAATGFLNRVGPLTAAQTTISFNAPAPIYGYVNLLFKVTVKTTDAADQLVFASYNSDVTAAHYGVETDAGVGNVPTSSQTLQIGAVAGLGAATANRTGAFEARIYNFNGNFHKMTVANGGVLGSTNQTATFTSIWAATPAITTIDFTLAAGNFDVGSSISMYGEA